MRLVDPTDFEILSFLDDSGRNNAINVSTALDLNRSYINTRLRELESQGLLQRVGPATNSGLYELTDRGRAALRHRGKYDDESVDFESLVDDSADDG